MLTELQTRKLTHLFNIYDVNRDGFLEESDYAPYALNIAQTFGRNDAE